MTALGLPTASPATFNPAAASVVFKNLDRISDADFVTLLRGSDSLVFPARVDDRLTPLKPAYPTFYYANVDVCVRVLRLAAQANIQREIVLRPYFTHFNCVWPELRLADRHPYIHSRVEQESTVTAIFGIDVIVLKPPYIFSGIPRPCWKSVWMPYVNYMRSTPVILYMQGGTSYVSAKTVGQAVVGALENGDKGKCYLIGDENQTWLELLTRPAAANGCHIRVLNLPI